METLNKGFDSKLSTTQLEGTWRDKALLQPLGYFVETDSVHQALISIQRLVADLPEYDQMHLPIWWVYHMHQRKITVLEGFATDFASVPRFGWLIIAPHEIRRPAVLHDALYRLLWALLHAKHITRKQFSAWRYEADLLFRESMNYLDPQIARWKRSMAYRAVRAFGGFSGAAREIETPRERIKKAKPRGK